ncbi:MAG: DUF1538 domain-containing protein [Desulfovibrio sp.]|nr:DUF1538 domain-containing protein [Desulfovibrio sp.]
MILVEKAREAAISVVPVMAVVWLLHLTVAPLAENLPRFLIGGLLLIFGLAIFLLGAELGIVPIGHRAGSAFTQKRNLPLLLGAGFVIGFFITVAEPDVHVLAQQVAAVDPAIEPLALVGMIAVGVGLFVALALARIVFQISLRLMLAAFYVAVFICAAFTAPAFLGIAFDAGGATTGPMTVPFILALGIGVASVRAGGQNDSFGLIGIASIGPVLSVLILGMFQRAGGLPEPAAAEVHAATLWGHFSSFVPEVAAEVGLALLPLVGLFALFRLFLLRQMTTRRLARVCMGLIYTYLGLILFFVGVKGGFIPAGASLGAILAGRDSVWLLLLTAFTLGALAVCAEPAVWVLTKQVENVSGGAIKSGLLLVFLCAGVAIAVALALLRVSYSLSLWWFLVAGYLIAFFMTLFCPPMFTAIAFDSGGVASGPMASTFILAFTLGASQGIGGNPVLDAFGVIALIAMTPLIAIQTLGMIYASKIKMSGAKR